MSFTNISVQFSDLKDLFSSIHPGRIISFVHAIGFLPARRYASVGYRDRYVSVRLSVRHAPVLCQNEESLRHDFFTIW